VTKRYDDEIEVTYDPDYGGAPLSFSWRGCRYEVDQPLSTWREADWSASSDREYHRVLARPAAALATGEIDADGFMRGRGAVYDVYRTNGTWRLARIWD
jgi:hypothetical protein